MWTLVISLFMIHSDGLVMSVNKVPFKSESLCKDHERMYNQHKFDLVNSGKIKELRQHAYCVKETK